MTDPAPFIEYQRAAVTEILTGPPSIYLFKHYYWLTGKAVPTRRNGQTNDQYVSRHWWRLRRAATEWSMKRSQTGEPNRLDTKPE